VQWRIAGERCLRWAAVETALALAIRAEMGSAAGDDDTANRCFAAAAGFAGAQVDAVLELEESTLAIGANVVRDRGAAELNGVGEDLAQRQTQPVQLGTGDAIGPTAWANSGMEQAFVGVDVSYACKQCLVQESGLDV
jgi:hypothetical protein